MNALMHEWTNRCYAGWIDTMTTEWMLWKIDTWMNVLKNKWMLRWMNESINVVANEWMLWYMYEWCEWMTVSMNNWWMEWIVRVILWNSLYVMCNWLCNMLYSLMLGVLVLPDHQFVLLKINPLKKTILMGGGVMHTRTHTTDWMSTK